MEKKEKYILGGAILLAVFLLAFFSPQPHHKEPFVLKGKIDDLASFLEANTVVVKIVYPFSDAQGAVGAANYLAAVLSAKGKKVIVESIQGNKCYTNEGNVEEVKVVEANACDLNLPTILIREGSGIIIIKPYYVEIDGPPPYLLPAASFILKKIYPDADYIYAKLFQEINRPRSEKRA